MEARRDKQPQPEIKDHLLTDEGIFVGLVHEDFMAHGWLVEQLGKNKDIIKYVFVEANQENIDAWDLDLTKKGVFTSNLGKRELALRLNEESKSNGMVFSFLYARYILNLEVIGVDRVSEEERKFLNENKGNPDLQIMETCLRMRMKNNDVMAENITKQIGENPGKYVFLGGALHYGLADLLKVKSIILVSRDMYAENESNLQHYFHSSGMKKTFYIYDHRNQTVTLSPNHEESTMSLGETNINPTEDSFSFFRGMLNRPKKQKNALESLKERMQKTYELKDTSSAELERGLRKAVVNSKTQDFSSFIKLGVDINAVSPKGQTALDLALERKLEACVKALKDMGAKTAANLKEQSESEFNLTMRQGK